MIKNIKDMTEKNSYNEELYYSRKQVFQNGTDADNQNA